MKFRRTVFASLLISLIVSLAATAVTSHFFHLSLSEMAAIFGVFFVGIFALALFITLIETQLDAGKPFRKLFILNATTLGLALWATLESVQMGATALLFLLFDFVSLLAMTRSYQLMLTYQRREIEDEPKIRELHLLDQILITINFIGFYIMLGFAIYFLHWVF
jgi:hypothetical protein